MPCPLCCGRKPRAVRTRFGCCSSSVVEHSLGKGGVESSILSCSTIFLKRFQPLKKRPLPLPPLFDREQNLKDASQVGKISGSRFAIRSSPLRPHLERHALWLSAFANVQLFVVKKPRRETWRERLNIRPSPSFVRTSLSFSGRWVIGSRTCGTRRSCCSGLPSASGGPKPQQRVRRVQISACDAGEVSEPVITVHDN